MTLGRCPLSIFCSRGTPPSAVEPTNPESITRCKVVGVVPRTHGVKLGIVSQLLSRNVERFRGGLVVKAHRCLYHSTLDSRVIKKKSVKAKAEAGTTHSRERLLSSCSSLTLDLRNPVSLLSLSLSISLSISNVRRSPGSWRYIRGDVFDVLGVILCNGKAMSRLK